MTYSHFLFKEMSHQGGHRNSFLLIIIIVTLILLVESQETLNKDFFYDQYYDNNQKLSSNLIIIQQNDNNNNNNINNDDDDSHCYNKIINNIWNQRNSYSNSRVAVEVDNEEINKFFNKNNKKKEQEDGSKESNCKAVCVNIGTAKELLYHPLPFLKYSEDQDDDEDEDEEKLLDWNYHCRVVEVSVVSFLPEELSLVWIDLLNPGKVDFKKAYSS